MRTVLKVLETVPVSEVQARRPIVWRFRLATLVVAAAVLILPGSWEWPANAAPGRPGDRTAAACTGDGSAAAPAGVPQHPALFSDYGKRPPCKVAGVDYHVGLPDGIRLKDPSDAQWRGALSLDGARHILRCDGGSNVTVSGYDFSLHGGIGIYDASCSNLTIENSKFGVGTNCVVPINQSADASGIVVRKNLIDGGGYVARCANDPVGENVLLGGSGTKIVEYNWIRNAAQHFVTLSGSGGQARMRFNLVERCGFFQGNHCNGLQFVGGSWIGPVVANNTFLSPQPDAQGGLHGRQTAHFVAGSTRATTGSAEGLVTLDHTYASSLASGMTITSPYLPPGTSIETVTNTGGPCCSGPQSKPVVTSLVLTRPATKTGRAPFDVPDAYPSGLVNPVQVDAQLNATIRNAKVSDNVVIAAAGPVKTVSYNISLDSDGTSINSGATMSNNYVDSGGAYGPFYPSDCRGSERCYGAAISGNIDLRTGKEIASHE
jgi:hypothetical protein